MGCAGIEDKRDRLAVDRPVGDVMAGTVPLQPDLAGTVLALGHDQFLVGVALFGEEIGEKQS